MAFPIYGKIWKNKKCSKPPTRFIYPPWLSMVNPCDPKTMKPGTAKTPSPAACKAISESYWELTKYNWMPSQLNFKSEKNNKFHTIWEKLFWSLVIVITIYLHILPVTTGLRTFTVYSMRVGYYLSSQLPGILVVCFEPNMSTRSNLLRLRARDVPLILKHKQQVWDYPLVN